MKPMNANETTGALAPSTCAEAQTIHHNRPALRIYHANAISAARYIFPQEG